MKRDYPGYEAYTRDVVLAREQGHTDNLKIGSAVLREFYLLGDRNGYTFAGTTTSTAGPPPRIPGAVRPTPMRTLPAGGLALASALGAGILPVPGPVPKTAPVRARGPRFGLDSQVTRSGPQGSVPLFRYHILSGPLTSDALTLTELTGPSPC